MPKLLDKSSNNVTSDRNDFNNQNCNQNLNLKGNIIPNSWYHSITTACGKPDSVGITILSELLFLYRYYNKTIFTLNYDYFQNKFNYSRCQIRDAFIRLEEKTIITRQFCTVEKNGKFYNNEMSIVINIEILLKYLESSSEDNSKKFTNSIRNFQIPYSEISEPNIDIKNNKNKNRSITSTFFEKNFEESSEKIESNRTVENFNNEVAFACKPQLNQENETVQLQGQQFFEKASASNTPKTSKETFLETEQTTLKTKKWFKKELREFYPLSEDDLDILTNTSGREFSLNFINQLLLRLADKYPDHVFYRKKSFINYMTKVLTYEMRQTTEVNNERFRFKRDDEESAKDKFLEEIEYSKETTKEAQFKRKIAAVFDKDLAYNLLLNSKFKIQKKSSKSRLNKSDKNILENILVAELPEGLKLTDVQKKILLEQGRAVYGDIEKLNLMTKASTENFNDCITDVLQKFSRSANDKKLTKASGLVKQAILSEEQEIVREWGNSVWGSVRLKLRSFYGQGIDKSWFAKLTVEEDQKNKKLKLKAPTEFIRDWIQQHYQYSIEEFCQKYEYKLEQIV